MLSSTDPSQVPPSSRSSSIPIAVATLVDDHVDQQHDDGHAVFSSSDVANEAIAAEAREHGTSMVRDHLDAHLSINPESSYVTWIAALHPENATVAIDPRFLTPGNPWMVVYQEAKKRDGNPHKKGGGNDPTIAVDAQVVEPDTEETPSAGNPKARGGFLEIILGFSIQITAIFVAFSMEIIGLYAYGSSVICYKIAKACTNNSRGRVNFFTALPFGICWLLCQVFRFIDTVLLFVSVLVIELLAGINYFLCSLFSLNCEVGRGAHQRTRRLAHLTRWAFRRKFDDWEPRRFSASCCSDGKFKAGDDSLVTPAGDGNNGHDDENIHKASAVAPATVAQIPEKDKMYDEENVSPVLPATVPRVSEKEQMYDS